MNMEQIYNFDDIRPYHDDEVNAALRRIAADPYFGVICNYVYPEKSAEEVAEFISGITSVRDFQYSVMRAFNEQVIKRSIRNFTYSGIENIPHDRACLFVSNHRDIVLDACLMQYILFLNDLPTTQITFGSNLMSSQLLIDIGRCNRMFRVERPGQASARQFYEQSLKLSSYLHHVISGLGESVWIAQRNGRTKNGIDRTSPAVIKMFAMADRHNPVRALAELCIVPVSVSYQFEPCAAFKARENLANAAGRYVKAPGEDLHSILSGITQYKGDVHFNFGKPLDFDTLWHLGEIAPQRFPEAVAEYMDNVIVNGYKLHSTNYIAADYLTGNKQYSDKYSAIVADGFISEINSIGDDGVANAVFEIYANPILKNVLD